MGSIKQRFQIRNYEANMQVTRSFCGLANMALILKRIFEGYFLVMSEKADPRVADYPLMGSPIPTIIILYLWLKFVFSWGPKLMKDKEPFGLKKIMIFYNIVQVITNGYIVYETGLALKYVNWQCTEVDYSESYWGRKFLSITYTYFILKILDLLDTVFFVLRKKNTHISFLHTYHHFGMVIAGWLATKFIGGGHSYFTGLANGIVHTILYSYYLLTAYDSKYGKLIWLKKLITQAQLIQFAFILICYGQLLFRSECKYPKWVSFILVPQNLFMVAMFSDFYVKNYILYPKKKEISETIRDLTRNGTQQIGINNSSTI